MEASGSGRKEDKGDTGYTEDKKEKETNKQLIPQLRLAYSVLKDSGQKSSIRQPYGMGLKTTTNRKKQEVRAVQAEAKKSFSIQGVSRDKLRWDWVKVLHHLHLYLDL